MPQIHAPELGAAIRRQYGVRGAQGFDTIAPEIIPVTIVDDIRREVPKQCRGRAGRSAVAGEFSFAALVAAAGILTKIHGIWVYSVTAATTFEVIMSNQTSITIVNSADKHYTDRRISGRPSAILGGGDEVAAPTGESIASVQNKADQALYVELGVTLSPLGGTPEAGSSRLVVHAGAVAQTIMVSFFWEESAAQPGFDVP